MTDRAREIADLKQTEVFLLQHGMSCLPVIPTPQSNATKEWIARVWWRVMMRRQEVEAEL